MLDVIDSGDGSGPDESRWTPGANVGIAIDFPGHCYLIHHTQGWFLWDTGIDDAVAQLPSHQTDAVSHSHPDHAGNIEMFPNTPMLVQRVEYEWAGSRQDTVAFTQSIR